MLVYSLLGSSYVSVPQQIIKRHLSKSVPLWLALYTFIFIMVGCGGFKVLKYK